MLLVYFSSTLSQVLNVEVEVVVKVVVSVEGVVEGERVVKYKSEVKESGLSFFCSLDPSGSVPSRSLLSVLSTSFFPSPPLSSSPVKFSLLFSVSLKKSSKSLPTPRSPS